MRDDQEMLGYDLRTYLDQVVKSDLEKYSGFITWTENDKNQFRALLDELKHPGNPSETAKEKGDHLEKLVEFIVQKTYFFEIYKNVRTKTNEIDEVIVLSDRGKQALKSFGLERSLIPIDLDLFLGECKNYKTGLGVTYVGKFYSLLSVTNISFGVLFTQNGLTGSSDGFTDAYGITKVLRMVEKAQGNDFYILTFTLEDYDALLNGKTFFDLIKAKKLEIQLAADYNKFVSDNRHEAESQIKEILDKKDFEGFPK